MSPWLLRIGYLTNTKFLISVSATLTHNNDWADSCEIWKCLRVGRLCFYYAVELGTNSVGLWKIRPGDPQLLSSTTQGLAVGEHLRAVEDPVGPCECPEQLNKTR